MLLMVAELELRRAFEEELASRQDQFATMFDIPVDPELLRGLVFCNECCGQDYEWTDWSLTDMDGNLFDSPDESQEYRLHLAEICCQKCDGTGFEGGSWRLEKEDWIELSHGIIPNNHEVS